MLYRKVAKNGDELSVLGFGCMRLPVTQERKIDEDRARAQLRYAIDNGVNYVDTAWPYHAGESELFLGHALGEGYREKVKLATKLPSWMIRSREDMDFYLSEQLKKLQTDHIDYYLVHNLNGKMWQHLMNLNIGEFLDAAKADGRIVNAGFSFHGFGKDFQGIVDAYPWEFCQIQYNYLDEENQAGTAGLKYAAAQDMAVIVMEPLRGGNLGLPEPPPAVDAIWKETPQQRTPAEWALRWVWNHPEVTVVLSGMNEEAHVEENLRIADEALPDSLSEEELATVAKVARKYQEIMKVPCTGCGYCKPCPSDVNIPVIFEVYNKLHMFGNVEEAKFMYAIRLSGMVTGEKGFASQCVQCGECLEKCPQHIEIPDHLENAVAELEGPDLEQRVQMGKKMFNME